MNSTAWTGGATTASCDAGDVVLSGGYSVSGGLVVVTGSFPNATFNGWVIEGFGGGSATIFAYCADVS